MTCSCCSSPKGLLVRTQIPRSDSPTSEFEYHDLYLCRECYEALRAGEYRTLAGNSILRRKSA